MKVERYYDDNGFLVGYADDNYCFIRLNDEQGNMTGYANSKGECSGLLCKNV
jgi:hypothetical protein